jgi:mono/diheme cytochrome c family protein
MNFCSRRHPTAWMVLSLIVLATLAGPLSAAPTSRQRAAINTLKRKAKMADEHYNAARFSESADLLKAVQEDYDKLLEEAGKEPGLLPLLEPVYQQLLRTHALLELEGIALPELKNPVAADTPAPADAASFTRQVAPVLVAKCGRCHVDSARGMFSMATYASLMKGSEAGVVIFAKDADGSRMIEMIESGDMPRGGLKVTPEELQVLKSWIAAGAKFDGDNPQQPIVQFAPNVQPADAPRVEVTRSTGKETISFANDIAPVLAEKCANCHGNGDRPAAQFNLANFDNMLRGGESGPPITPGQPAESLLIKKLKGTASGARMPRGQQPLADAVIAKFEKWIEEGATFDGPDPQQNVVDVAALAKALRASHEELAQDREQRARQNWQLGLPGISSDLASTDNFLLVGNVGSATLAEYGKQAEAAAGKVREILKGEANRALIKGRMTLFVVGGRYDYSEFGKMVEQRQLPSEWRGHWRYTIVDAYGALVPARAEEFGNEALLAQLIASTYVSSLGDAPRWFAEGVGRSVASKVSANDPRVIAWDEQISGVMAGMSKPDDFLAGKPGPEAADVASYRFVSFLLSRDARRFHNLLRAVGQGQPFEEAFLQTYGATPAQVTPLWAQAEARGRRR